MREGATRWFGSVSARLIGFVALWWALSEGAPGMWPYGAVIVPFATAVSYLLMPPSRRRWRPVRRTIAFGQLLVWFLWQSFLGGVDVALRAIRRPVDVDPVMIEYRLSLTSLLGRIVVAHLNTLSPGTLSVELDGDVLHVHVLHASMPTSENLADLERRVSRVFDG